MTVVFRYFHFENPHELTWQRMKGETDRHLADLPIPYSDWTKEIREIHQDEVRPNLVLRLVLNDALE